MSFEIPSLNQAACCLPHSFVLQRTIQWRELNIQQINLGFFFSLLCLIQNNSNWGTQKRAFVGLAIHFSYKQILGPVLKVPYFRTLNFPALFADSPRSSANKTGDTFPAVHRGLLKFDPHQTACKPLQIKMYRSVCEQQYKRNWNIWSQNALKNRVIKSKGFFLLLVKVQPEQLFCLSTGMHWAIASFFSGIWGETIGGWGMKWPLDLPAA